MSPDKAHLMSISESLAKLPISFCPMTSQAAKMPDDWLSCTLLTHFLDNSDIALLSFNRAGFSSFVPAGSPKYSTIAITVDVTNIPIEMIQRRTTSHYDAF